MAQLSSNNNRSMGRPFLETAAFTMKTRHPGNPNHEAGKTARIRLRNLYENKASRAQASINSASRICQLAIRSLGSGKVLFRGFSGEAAVSVLFRVRLALGSQLRDGGVLIVFNPIILPVGIRRSSVFLTKNLTSDERCESLVFRHQEVIEFVKISFWLRIADALGE